MNRSDEQRLIRRAAAGDRAAAEEFIKAYQPSLYAYILRLSGRPDVAEDTVQEAFVRVLTNLDRFDYRFRFSTWLFTIGKRLYVNAAQKHKPAYDSDLVGSRVGASARPEAGTERGEAIENLHEALDLALASLPAEQREVLVLFHQLDMPIAVIARQLEMPEGTVKSHLHRGRRKLREFLETHERAGRLAEEAWA